MASNPSLFMLMTLSKAKLWTRKLSATLMIEEDKKSCKGFKEKERQEDK